VVTPRVEVSPDRSDFAKSGETIAASLVQAAQEHANHASVLLKQTKQFADDIRSQVAASSSDPSFHTHASGLMTCEATQDDIRGNPERQRESRCVMAGRAVNAHKAPTNEVGILATIDRQCADEQTSVGGTEPKHACQRDDWLDAIGLDREYWRQAYGALA
jgi:hypothetical protein